MTPSDAKDQIEEIQSCFLAIADLMNPGGDIGETQRDHIAVLMDFLLRHQCQAFEQLSRQ